MKQSNTISQGYKNSPLGIIPEDWEVKKLGEVGIFLKGKGVPKDKITTSGYKCLTYGDIYTKYDIVMKNIKSFIDEETALISEELKTGDILFAGSGETLEDIGKTLVYLDNDKAYAGGDIIIFRQNQMNSLLLSYLLNSSKSNSQKYQMGQGHSVVHIYSSQLENLLISIPPLPEQQKIAEILSVWDRAIDAQTQLIASLQTRKRALMQQLLTGKKRLKGFSGEWETVKLGEIGRFVSGSGFSDEEQGGLHGTPFYKVSDMNLCGNELYMTNANNYVTDEQIERCKYKVIDLDAVIFAKVGAAIFLERKRLAKSFLIDNNMMAFIPQNNNIIYVKYLFDTIKLSKYIQIGALPSYNASDLSSIRICMPPIPEQTAIAEILSTADKEITLSQKKLAAMKSQKKGLMQVLLTGKRRVEKRNKKENK
jgi:type I restriction enzyme S subunit